MHGAVGVVGRAGIHGRFVAPFLERREIERDPFTRRERPHEQLAEALRLVEVDDTLLVQLEHREEPHDHFELGARADRQVAEAHRARRRQEREDRLDRIADAGPDRRDVLGVDFGLDLGRESLARRREERVERDPFERVRSERAEGLLGTGAARDAATGVGEAAC